MPNLLFIVAEELRADALSCNGNAFCKTPHLDGLAREGVRFGHHYTVHGKCVPSRVAMLTGTYPSALGCRELTTYPQGPLAGGIVAHLKKEGWRLGLFGKNHMLRPEHAQALFDTVPPPGPTFQEYRVADYDALPPQNKPLYQGRIEQPVEATRDWISVDQLDAFLAEADERPFFAWLNFEHSHPPYAAPEPFFSSVDRAAVPPPRACDYADKPAVMALLHRTWGVDALSADQLREIKAVYHAQVQLVDAMVGRTLALLEARGLRENTLVVFTSDHGDFAGEYGLVEKWDTLFHEEIMRVPLLVAGPGVQHPGRGTDALVENLDILPSLLDLLGIAPAPCVQHALSFAPLLRGETDQHRESVYAEGGVEVEGLRRTTPLRNGEAYAGKHRALALDPLTLASARMLRTPTHKLVFRREGMNELYDLTSPDGESVNVYADPANAPLLAELLPQLLARQIAAAPRYPALPETGVMA